MLQEYLFKYLDKFGENFPIYMCMGFEEDEIIGIIKDCLKSDKPYEVEEEEGADY